ncbi:uncharacterized protein LOC144201549 [Stigmatopora nigra]
MYAEGARGIGHRTFQQPNGSPCPCQCGVRQAETRFRGASGQISSDRVAYGGGDNRDFRVLHQVMGRTFLVPGAVSQSDDSVRLGPTWESNPNPVVRWRHSQEADVRHCRSYRENCDCMITYNRIRPRPFHVRIPHPLPHLRGNGQVCSGNDTFVERDEDRWFCTQHNGSRDYPIFMFNGHSGLKLGPSKKRELSGDPGGSVENCNGGLHVGFFPTEVPQKHLQRDKSSGFCEQSRVVISSEARGQQDSVRDQIRQVVTDLEDVLGGLKQVHVEMKEVVEQIDHLTAKMNLGEQPKTIACEPSAKVHISVQTQGGGLTLSPAPPRKPILVNRSKRSDEERIILRTNSPSPVHMASVVKTHRFTPPDYPTKNHKHLNGHPPLPYPDIRTDPRESRSQNLNPQVVIENSTMVYSRTPRPPLYPQNGSKDPQPSSKVAKTPTSARKCRQNNSVV